MGGADISTDLGGVKMAKDQHLQTLKSKHADLETLIHQEAIRPQPDQDLINRLKREKLRLKEEISTFSHSLS